jgi:hypothetical protein
MKPVIPEQEALCKDALALLRGQNERFTGNWRGYRSSWPLSNETEPTEKQGRIALCEALRNMAEDYPVADIRHYLLISLMSVFAPSHKLLKNNVSPFKAILKRRTQGHSDAWFDRRIAIEVARLRKGGLSYDRATAELAEKLGKSQRQIQRILAKTRRDNR